MSPGRGGTNIAQQTLKKRKEHAMKKLFCAMLMIGCIAVNHSFAQEDQPTDSWITIEPRQYKIDEQCNVMSTGDGLNWAASTNNSWRGLDGSWYMIDNRQVFQSLDGFRWQEVPGNTWQDALGNSYKLTNECALITGNEEGLNQLESDEPVNPPQQEVKPGDRQEESKKVQPQSKAEIEQEQIEYQAKISRRISDLEEEIADLKKDLRDHPENEAEIQKREETQEKLKDNLEKMGQTLDEEWDELKEEIDRMF
jgi:hypothetical protein